MSVARLILGNTAAQIFGKFLTALLSIVVIKLISNYLGTAGYGEYNTIYEFLAFFGIAADLGLFTISVREMSVSEKRIPHILANVLSIRTVLTVITMCVAVSAAFLIPKYAGTRIPLGVAIASVTTLLTILNGTLATVLQVHLKMQYVSLSLVIGKVVTVGYMLFAVFKLLPENPHVGFFHLLGAGIIGNLAMFAMTAHFVRRYTTIRYEWDFDFWKSVLKKSLPYGVALFLNTVYFRVDTILMSLMLPREVLTRAGDGSLVSVCETRLCSNTQIGLYAVAMRMLEAILIIPLYFMNSVLPILSRALKQGSEQAMRVLQYAFDFLTVAAFPIVVGGFVLAFPIVFVVSSPEYLSDLSKGFFGSDIALKILLFAMLFAFLNNFFNFLLVALEQQMKLLWLSGTAVIVNVATSMYVIPTYGFRGAAAMSVLSELIILVGSALLARRYIRYRLSLTTSCKALVSAILMGVCVFYVYEWTFPFMQAMNVLLLVPLGGLLYAGFLFATGAITKNHLALLRKGETKETESLQG